jgi:uncharacterized membrane protein
VRNPLRSEDAAFRFVLAAGLYLGLIGLGSLVGTWVGVAVFVVLTLAVAWWLFRPGHAG